MPKLAGGIPARFNPKMMNRRQKVNLDWGYDISQLRPITDRTSSQMPISEGTISLERGM